MKEEKKEAKPDQSANAAAAAAAAAAPAPQPAGKKSERPVGFEEIAKTSAFRADEIVYDERVQIWFDDETAALNRDPYKTYGPRIQRDCVVAHTFPPFLDRLIGTAYCLAGENKVKQQYHFICSVSHKDQRKDEATRGVFTIALDDKQHCFHRVFLPKTSDQMADALIQGEFLKDIEFPSLGAGSACKKKLPTTIDGYKVSVDPSTQVIEVFDSKREVTIQIFCLRE